MSPILVRPVREQLEHDRVIRVLQTKLRRRGTVTVNSGEEQNAPVKVGSVIVFPDLVVTAADGGRRIAGVVEVETGESVNHLEAMAQWVPMGKARARFSLYVPAGASDVARRLCVEHQVKVSEIWAYHAIGEQIRLSQVYRAPADRTPASAKPKASATRARQGASKRPSPRARAARPARRTARSAKKSTRRSPPARTGGSGGSTASRRRARASKRK